MLEKIECWLKIGHHEITQSTYPITLVMLILLYHSYILDKELLLEVCALVTRLV
jgi:hypothetical protein